MLNGAFSTPYDYVVSWKDLPNHSLLLLQYDYNGKSTILDVTNKSYYTIVNLGKPYAQYEITLYIGQTGKLLYNATSIWGQWDSKETLSSSPRSPEAAYTIKKLIREIGKSMSGTEILIFIPNRNAKRCACVAGTGRPNPHCKICYGTGFIGGYQKPIHSVAQILETTVVDGYELRRPGAAIITQAQIIIPYTYELRKHDIVYDIYTKEAYMCLSNHIDKVGGKYPILQTLSLNKLPGEHIIYEHPSINKGNLKARTRSNYIYNRLP